MDQAAINVWAVLLAIVVKQVLGFVWYSPLLFGRTFATLSGQSEEEMQPRMAKAVAGDAVSAVAMSVVLAHLVSYAGVMGPLFGAVVGMLCWIGFAAPASLSPSLFERRSPRLWVLQNGYLALSLAAMGAILGGWR